MGRKKLTKILLSAGCRLNLKNHQRETALDIGIRKGYEEICEMLQNPPKVVTPLQRDELRASKYNNSKSASSSGSKSKSEGKARRRDLSVERSGGGSSGRSHLNKRDKSGGGSSKRSSSKDSPSQSRSSNNEVAPNWSPYGCHYHPNPQAFPPPNIDSLPEEPLRSGELYYLDLAGNIHKVSCDNFYSCIGVKWSNYLTAWLFIWNSRVPSELQKVATARLFYSPVLVLSIVPPFSVPKIVRSSWEL